MLGHLGAALLFVVYAVALSYPLILELDTQIPGTGAGDNVAFLWNVWWFRYALFDPALTVFHTQHLFAPFGTSLVLHTHTALPAFVGATIFRSWSVVEAQNLVVLAGLAANGMAAYALAYHYVKRALPAMLAGVVFGGCAYLSIHLLGHFNLIHAWVLPFAALAWIRCLEAPAISCGFGVGAAFAAAAYTDYYYFSYALMFAAGWWLLTASRIDVTWNRPRWHRTANVLVWLMLLVAVLIVGVAATGGFRFELGGWRVSVSHIRNPLAALWLLGLLWLALHTRYTVRATGENPLRRGLLSALGIAVVVWTIAMLPLIVPAVGLVASGDYVSPPQTWRSGPRGIDVLTLILGNPMHTAHGPLTLELYARLGVDVMEQSAWLGAVPLLVLAALAARRLTLDVIARRWLWIGVFFFVWSCGAYLIVGGMDTGIPLPQALARLVPFLSNARMPGRAIIMVQLAAAIICAIAATKLQWRRSVIVGLVVLAIIDNLTAPFPIYQLPRSGPVETAIATPGGGAVIELPVGIRDGFGERGGFDHRALVHQSVHHKPLAGGFVARLSSRLREQYETTPAFASLMRLSVGENGLPENLASELFALGITHIVVNTDAMPRPVDEILESRGMRLVMVSGSRALYQVGSGPR